MKQNSLDDHESLNMDVEAWVMHDANEELAEMSENDERRMDAGDPSQQYNYENPPSTSTPVPLPMLRGQYILKKKQVICYLNACYYIFVGQPYDASEIGWWNFAFARELINC